jgi:hypothetical protein
LNEDINRNTPTHYTAITERQSQFHRPFGPRLDEHSNCSELGRQKS